MKRVIINLAVFALTFAAGAILHTVSPIVSPQAQELESYAVYSAVIREFHNGEGSLVLIYDSTSVSPPYEESAAAVKVTRKAFRTSTMPEVLRDYRSKNVTLHALTSRFSLVNRYALVNHSENYFANAGNFHSQYPNSRGIIALSAVGFNARMDQALVYAREYCAGECGGGFYLLTKQNGGWAVSVWQLA